MIWIIGGTVESGKLCKKLEGVLPYILTVATEGGLQFTEASNVAVGRLSAEEMDAFIKEKGIEAIVDASHPYAKIVSELAKEAAKRKGIPYYRYVRPKNKRAEHGIFVRDVKECGEVLDTIKGCVFFTTGSKNIKDFEPHRGENRFIYRVLPTSESFRLAEDAGVHMRDLIGALGPFDVAFNRYMFQKYKVDYCVTKESGRGSGVDEKLVACKEEGVVPIVILREDEDGYSDGDELIRDLVKDYESVL